MNIIKQADILLPQGVDFKKWAVVACDQFTSQPKYWKEVEEQAGEVSAYRLVLPEIYLKEKDVEERIRKVNETMRLYEAQNVFRLFPSCAILVERQTGAGVRLGLVAAVDLEAYDYLPGNDKPVKATEATVEERLPARVRIREGASLELPHTMILLDDKERTVIESIYEKRDSLQKLYDFELMQGGGHIRGYLVEDNEPVEKINELCRVARGNGSFALAVGDGNHSLASAKKYYEKAKATMAKEDAEKARWCLAEIVNLHSPSLVFEPIYRVVYGGGEEVVNAFSTMKGNGKLKLYRNGEYFEAPAPENSIETIAAVQKIIDELAAKRADVSCDYIHGAQHLLSVADASGALAVFLPALDKNELFRYVSKHGILPRKSFSMGEAEEKRYYIECKKIK